MAAAGTRINAQAPTGPVVVAVPLVAPAAAAPLPRAGGGGGGGTARQQRATVGKVLFVLGCAAAALALFSMSLDPHQSILFLGPCAPSDADVANLSTAAQEVLVTAAAQVVASAVAVVEPSRPFAVVACASMGITAIRVALIVPMLVSCNDAASHASLVTYYTFFLVVMVVAFFVCVFLASLPDQDD